MALSHLIVFRKLVRTAPLSLSQLSSGLTSSTLQILSL
nr:MAG TPA: hypothetical protein [Caudoviricetes sp.]